MTIGQQLGQNLYVRVQQGIGDQSQTNFILEYELTEWLRLQTNVLQGSSTQQQLFQRMQGQRRQPALLLQLLAGDVSEPPTSERVLLRALDFAV